MANGLKDKVVELRRKGMVYSEILRSLNVKIPKSTLSYWCKDIVLSDQQKIRINKIIEKNAKQCRKKALEANRNKREIYLQTIKNKNLYLGNLLRQTSIAKISLSLLYLSEGSKSQRGSLMFGNSNPEIIKLFLKLLRKCYDVDENKFRCTLQCRADQNIQNLEKFWSNITGIPLKQFYKARVDPRSINSISKKKDYKGVCRIDYFSAHIYNELKIVADILYEGL